MDQVNLAIVRQSFANTVFTHQVQEAAANRKTKKATTIKIINIGLTSLVLITLGLQATQSTNLIYTYIGLALTIAELIFLVVQLSFPYESESALHKSSALKYMGLRDRYRSLIADIMNERISKAEIIARRDMLQSEYQSISDMSPTTTSADYNTAQLRLNKKGLVSDEQFTWSDEEIDRFLPEDLRISNVQSDGKS